MDGDIKCVYPGCSGHVKYNKSLGGLCKKHSEQLRFLLWVLDNIQLNTEERKLENSENKS